MASIEGKVFALTGGSSVIGLATCVKLVQLKAKALSIADVNEDAFESVKKQLLSINPEVKLLTTKVDVTSSEEVDKWVSATVEAFGDLDGAVNCAGVLIPAPSKETPLILSQTDDHWRTTINVNLLGTLFCMRGEVKAMMALERKPRTIVNISSGSTLFHQPELLCYGVSKTALTRLTTVTAKDVKPYGIRINAMSPSAIKTKLSMQFWTTEEEAEAAMEARGMKLIAPEVAEKSIIWLLAEESSEVFGLNLLVGAAPS